MGTVAFESMGLASLGLAPSLGLASLGMASSLGLAPSGLWILRSAHAPLLGRRVGRMALRLVIGQ